MSDRTHFVYRVWDSFGTLLYIGCTKDPGKRWTAHRADKSLWVPYADTFKLYGPYDRAEAFGRESAAIEAERPAFNALSAHRRSQHANYTRRESLLRALRVRRPELFGAEHDSPLFHEYMDEYDRIVAQADAEVPSIGAPQRHAAYLATRGQRRLVVVA